MRHFISEAMQMVVRILALTDISLVLSICQAYQHGSERFTSGNTFNPYNDPKRFWQIKKLSHKEVGDLFGLYGWSVMEPKSLEAILERASDCPCLLKVFFPLSLCRDIFLKTAFPPGSPWRLFRTDYIKQVLLFLFLYSWFTPLFFLVSA